MHLIWMVFFFAGTIAAAGALFNIPPTTERLATGSTTVGMLFGIAAALVILFEVLLWPRKRIRRQRLGRLRTWMCAHIWLGLLTIPLALAHGGLIWRGSLAIALMVVLIATVASGVIGLILQNCLPRLMRTTLPEETVFSQIEHIAAQYLAEADALVAATCGSTTSEEAASIWKVVSAGDQPKSGDSQMIVGAVRSISTIKGTALVTELPDSAIPNTELMHTAYQSKIRNYLQQGRRSNTSFHNPEHTRQFFDDLREKLDVPAHPALQLLEHWCECRRQFDRQRQIYFWLHSWLALHIPLSVALVVLLVWHIVSALHYSGIFSLY